MDLVDHNAAIEDVIAVWSGALGPARDAYRGHVYRVFNCARTILGSERADDTLAIAAAFHDLGIWSDHTFDYLAPSATRARAHVEKNVPALDLDLVERTILEHHKLTRVSHDVASNGEVVDAFRRADLVDVSRGLLKSEVSKPFLREIVQTFPYAGFHGILIKTALGWFVRHPLRPMPMLKW